MSAPRYFEIDGIVVPLDANLSIRQSYETLMGATDRPIRMMNGDGHKQYSWSNKLRTEIRGNGWLPAAFDALDYTQPMLMKCAGARGIGSVSNAISLPSARRTDAPFEPYAVAVVDGIHVDSPVNLVVDTATVDVVAGASHYIVYYFPEFTAWVNPVETDVDVAGTEYDWIMTAEEQ